MNKLDTVGNADDANRIMKAVREMGRWVRGHTLPKDALKGADLFALTPRGRWLYERSLARYQASPDGIKMAALGRATMPAGEIGYIERCRFISTP